MARNHSHGLLSLIHCSSRRMRMKKSIFIIFNILVIVFTFKNLYFANAYLKDEYKLYGDTIESDNAKYNMYEIKNSESKKVTKTENSLDLVVAYKNEKNGKIDGSYKDVGNGRWEQDDEMTDLQMLVTSAWQDIKENIRKNTIPYDYNYEYTENKKKSNNYIIITILFIILLLSIVLLIVIHKKIIIIVCIIVFSLLINQLFIYITPEDNYNHIAEYILGISDKHIAKGLTAERSMKLLDDKLNNIHWSIAKIVNDYIVKTYASIFLYSNNIEPVIENYHSEYDEIDYEYIDGFDSIAEIEQRNSDTFASITMYNFKESDCVSNYLYDYDGISRSGISMIDCYRNLLSNRVNNFEYIINHLLDKLSYNDEIDKELLFHYVARISPSLYIMDSNDYYNNDVISYFKDWYINGESRNIELPYGVILEYKKHKFVKKDIQEILYTNERELDHESKEPQVLVIYYKDSKGNISGVATDITFTKTGTDYEMSFDPFDLLYEITRPTAILTIK